MTDRSVVYRLRAEIGQFSAQMAQASASTRKVAGDLTGLTKEGERSRQGLDRLGSAAGKIGLVAAAGLGAAVIKAADFDSSMSKVQAATHESAGAMEDLRQAALDAGAVTAFSATEAASGIENLAKAGVSTQDILGGGLMGALDLAAAGELEVADAAEIAATTMNQFGLAGEDVSHIADVLAASAGKAQGEVSDMAGALKFVGPVAAQMGVSLEETAGSIAELASKGIIGEQAGTSLRGMLTALTSPSKVASEEMAALGISMYDAQGQFIGLEGVAGQLHETMSNLGQAERDEALGRIFGNEQITAARILYQGGAEAVADWTKKVDAAGFAAETAAIKQDNLRGDLEKLGGSLETALIGTGEGAQGPLRDLVQNLEDVVNAYNRLPGGAQTAVAGLLAAGAALGGSVWLGGKLVNGIASARETLDLLGVSAETQTKGLGRLGRAASIAGGLLAGLAVVDFAQGGMKDFTIGVESMTQAILGMNDVTDADLPKNLDGLANSIDRLANPNKAEAFQDTISNALGGIGNEEEYDRAIAQMNAIDESLTGLVESGNQAAAAQWLSGLGLSEAQMQDFMSLLPGYKDALAGVANETGQAADDTAALGGAAEGATSAVAGLSEAAEKQAEALKKARDAARATGEEFFGVGEKVDKAKVSLNEWIRDMEKQAQALREFTANAQTAAKRGLDEGLIASLEEMGPAGALRMAQLADATETQIARANRAWRSGTRAIDDHTDAIGGVPSKVTTTVEVNYQDALIGIDKVRDRLAKLKDKTLTIRVTASGTAALTPGFGPQFASGGWTGPGGKYQPKGVVHGDEYVFSKEATHGNVAILERLHRQLRGYAQGGLVQRTAAAPVMSMGGGSVDIDYGRLASAMAQVRPLYGNVHVTDGYGGFKRQMQADQQRAGLGGI